MAAAVVAGQFGMAAVEILSVTGLAGAQAGCAGPGAVEIGVSYRSPAVGMWDGGAVRMAATVAAGQFGMAAAEIRSVAGSAGAETSGTDPVCVEVDIPFQDPPIGMWDGTPICMTSAVAASNLGDTTPEIAAVTSRAGAEASRADPVSMEIGIVIAGPSLGMGDGITAGMADRTTARHTRGTTREIIPMTTAAIIQADHRNPVAVEVD